MREHETGCEPLVLQSEEFPGKGRPLHGLNIGGMMATVERVKKSSRRRKKGKLG